MRAQLTRSISSLGVAVVLFISMLALSCRPANTPEAPASAGAATLTDMPALTETPLPTDTSLPAGTPTWQPILIDERTRALAESGATRNGDWEPYTEVINGVEMALIPAGCFQMGDAGEVCFDVPFWMDVYEVTNDRYGSSGNWPGDDRPRESVNWYDAGAYCESRGMRLPTESEWEYAARGPDGLIYPWGNEFVADNAVYEGNSGGETANVGSRPGGVSWVGLYDMSGNVSEWTSSPYDSASYVMRGGSWYFDASFLRSAVRGWESPSAADSLLGFRCALAYGAQETAEEPLTTPISEAPVAARASAFNGVARNADWDPIIQDFNGVEMALVPAGCFMMGNENGEDDERPVRWVCFEEPFWIDIYEVTNGQYGGASPDCMQWSSRDNQPRICINWYEATTHCDARGGRLPTDEEWEYAARGPDALMYAWGNEFVVDNVVYHDNSDDRAASVGSRPGGVSWVGAYDMSGNAWEWSRGGEGDYRMLRGGSWSSYAVDVRSSMRNPLNSFVGSTATGFRCARDY